MKLLDAVRQLLATPAAPKPEPKPAPVVTPEERDARERDRAALELQEMMKDGAGVFFPEGGPGFRRRAISNKEDDR